MVAKGTSAMAWMKSRVVLSIALLFVLGSAAAGLTACKDEKSESDEENTSEQQRLLGEWREETTFESYSEEHNNEQPDHKKPTIVFEEKTYSRSYPAAGGEPLAGGWEVKKVDGDELLLEMTLDFDGTEMRVDDQKVKFVSEDSFEMRNAENGSGGLYKRLEK